MRKMVLAAILISLSAACESHTSTMPTAVQVTQTGSGASAASISAAASVPVQHSVFSVCPVSPPFFATVPIVVTAGNVNLFLTGISFEFTDRNGARAPQVTLPAPIPTVEFGSALVEARRSRNFPVDFRFGCGTLGAGTISMRVRTRDANGVDGVQNLNVAVR